MAAPVLALIQSGNANTSVSRAFAVKERGAVSLSTSGLASAITTGYAEITPQNSGDVPSGMAILSFRQDDVLVSETVEAATHAIRSGRLYAEITDSINTGVSVANPNDTPVTVNFHFLGMPGNPAAGTLTLAPHDHAATFLDETSTYNGPKPFHGTFSFTATAPVAAAAFRLFRNERGEVLMSTLPVVDTDATPATGALVPHFVDGGGWTSQIILINPTDKVESGALEFRDDTGALMNVAISGTAGNAYSIPPRSAQKIDTNGVSPLKSGSIRVLPTTATAPVAQAALSYKPGEVTVSQTVAAGVSVARAFRLYVETYGVPDEPGNAQAGIAVANAGSAAASIALELFWSDGSTAGLPPPATFILPAYGHTAKFLSDFFDSRALPVRFAGIVRISTSSSTISVAGLRTRSNERGEFLSAALMPVDEDNPPATSSIYLPQFADGGGYTTRFVLFRGDNATQTAAGTLSVTTRSTSSSLALIPSVARSSGSIAITSAGKLVLNVNPDSGSVSALDATSDRLVSEIAVGKDPRCVTLTPDDRLALVTNRESATLAIIDTATLRVLSVIATDAEPYGVVAAPSGTIAYVASAAQDMIDIVRIAGGTTGITSRIAVGPKPKGLALSSDGSTLFVTHFLSGDVSVVNTPSGRVTEVISTGDDSNMVQKIAIHPGNHRAYLPHIRSNTTNPFLLFDNTVFPTISVLDMDHDRLAPSERVDLSIGPTSVNMPFDAAFSTDGARLYTVQLGSGDLAVIDLQTRSRRALIDVGDGPDGVVISADGTRAYVNDSLSGDIGIVDLETLQLTKRIPVTQSPLPISIQHGKVLFFSSHTNRVSRDRWMSCASCHFDGEQDGRTWMFASGLRNTTSLRGVVDTLPLHWSADRDEVQDFELTVRTLQAGSGLITTGEPNPELGPPNAGRSADLDALAAYVLSLQVKASPYRGNVDRGRAIFNREDAGCVTCHPAPRYTDSTLNSQPFVLHDVGTGDGPGERVGPAFDTPSLHGVWDTAPYLHDGSAPSLRDVLVTRNPLNRHGHTSQLSESEIADLIAFLKSL